MHPELIWDWLDTVDQENLNQFDQWGWYDADAAVPLQPTQPLRVLLRDESVRMTGQGNTSVQRKSHPKSLVPGSSHDLQHEHSTQSKVPAIAAQSPSTAQVNATSMRQHQPSKKEGNDGPRKPQRRPIDPDQALLYNLEREMQSTSISRISPTSHQVKDPVAVNCLGARVLERSQQQRGRRHHHLQNLSNMNAESQRRNTTAAGERTSRQSQSHAFGRLSSDNLGWDMGSRVRDDDFW